MVSINSSELGGLHFMSDLPPVVITTDQDNVRVTIREVDWSGNVIYDETLTPYDGKVTLYDMEEIVLPYLRKSLYEPFYIEAETKSGKANAYLRCVFLSQFVELGQMPESFARDQFLSLYRGARRTELGRKEVIHTLSTQAEAATIRNYYADGTYDDRSVENSIVIHYYLMDYYGYDASPFQPDGKELVRYVLTVGNRTQEYIIDGEHQDPSVVMMFINSFGVPEFVYLNGEVKGQPEYERKATVINGVYRNYKVKETRFWEANTGMLTEDEEEWMLELLRSQEVYVCRDNEPWREVTITESEAESSSDPYALTSYKLKYRVANKVQSMVSFRTSPSIFTQQYMRIYA